MLKKEEDGQKANDVMHMREMIGGCRKTLLYSSLQILEIIYSHLNTFRPGVPVLKLMILIPEFLRHHLETYHLFQSDKFYSHLFIVTKKIGCLRQINTLKVLKLDKLCKPTFEPPRWDYIKQNFTTCKTVFLFTLAFSHRCSEIHSISRDKQDAILGNDRVYLKTIPNFF